MLAVHRAWRGDALAGGLADLLRRPLDDPFTPEVVAVPTRGVERWLSQHLATVLGASPDGDDGVCANVAFPFPGTLIGAALAAATGIDPETDPWRPERAVWPLLAVVDERLDEPWLAILAGHLGVGRGAGAEVRRSRRFGTVRHLADLYDRYAVHRPDLVAAWATGGSSPDVPADLAWQGELWRALRAEIGCPSPAERLVAASAVLRADPGVVDLPARLSLFGLTRLPASSLAVLAALGHHRDVHLWLLHPSPALWDRVAAGISSPVWLGRRAEDPAVVEARNPLLATWGRDAREMQLVLAAAGVLAGPELGGAVHPQTLLGRIQADLCADRPPVGTPWRPPLDAGDRSLQVHACHGPGRQVEVLRDAILHLLADDPSLEPRDVIVMCPDIDAFAPLIQATFGTTEQPGQGRDLHVRLADRSIRQTNPVLSAVAALLDLAGGRVRASEVLDLAGREPVRRRFRFDDDDLATIHEWVRATGVRWGIDAAGRAAYQLDRLPAGTWAAGLDRLLLGVAMSEDGLRTVDGVLPLDDLDSGDIELVGRLAELIDRLRAALADLAGPQPIACWLDAIDRGALALFATADADAAQLGQLRTLLDDVRAATGGVPAAGRGESDHDHDRGPAAPAAWPPVLTLTEVRALLAERLRGQPTRANFRTGHLTMCTLVPMRSVPHRVVCLLGMDDGSFPRHASPDGDDLIAGAPRVGDRDGRAEDRQLLLDAVLAAREHLVIAYTGRDPRTNGERPPAVPVGELLDVVDRTVRVDSGAARDRIVTEHPLQPFDPRNFAAGRLGMAQPWSFDPVHLEGARATGRPRRPVRLLEGLPLVPAPADPVELDRLVQFVQHPVRAFLRQRLGVTLGWDADEVDDDLPLELDNLQRWAVGDRVLARRLAGVPATRCAQAEHASGALPPGTLGARLLDQVMPRVEELVAAARTGERVEAAEAVDVTVALPGGRVLVGTVGGCVGDVVRSVTYSQLAARHRLAGWVRFLALSAGHPDVAWTGRAIGRGSGTRPVRVSTLTFPAGGPGGGAEERRIEAVRLLDRLVDLYDRGRREPLPLWAKTSAAWAEAVHRGGDGERAARGIWKADGDIPGEDNDPAHQLVYGGIAAFDDLAALPPDSDEQGPDWFDHQPGRAGRLALRLWQPLLERER